MNRYKKSTFDIFKSRDRYQRRFSYDIDGDVQSARKLRKNSLTGRSAALDIVLHSNVLQDKQKNSFANKTRHKQHLKKTKQQCKSDFEIDATVLKDFEDAYENSTSNNGSVDISTQSSLSSTVSNDNFTSNGIIKKSEIDILGDVNGNFATDLSNLHLTEGESQSLEASEQDVVISKKYSLYRYNIVPDGNCLYRAISQAVYTDDEYHLVLRQATINYIAGNIDDFKCMLEQPVKEFLQSAKCEGEWAGYPEILAMTRLLNININITTGGSCENPNVQTTCHYYYTDSDMNGPNKRLIRQKSTTRPTVWISWLSSGHYDLLSDVKMENPKYQKFCQKIEQQNRLDEELALKISKEGSPIHKRKHNTKKLTPSPQEYKFSSSSSLQNFADSCSNNDFSSAFDMDLLRHSDLYA